MAGGPHKPQLRKRGKGHRSDRFGEYRVTTAHRAFSDICERCGDYIERNDLYVRTGKELMHYRCIKSRVAA